MRSPLKGAGLFLSGLLASLALSGCVATTTDIDRLQESLHTMEKTQDRMQKSQADLISKMEELDHSLVALGEKLDESQKKMSVLTQKLEDTQSRLGNRMENISYLLSQATTQATIATPGELYRTAFGDYQSGKTDLALSGFKTFLDRYPDSDLTDSARFYLADCLLAKKNYADARIEFDKVLAVSREYRPQALLKRARALQGLKQAAAQKETLQALLKEFPLSAEAQAAKQMLKDLEEDDRPAKPKEKKSPQPKK